MIIDQKSSQNALFHSFKPNKKIQEDSKCDHITLNMTNKYFSNMYLQKIQDMLSTHSSNNKPDLAKNSALIEAITSLCEEHKVLSTYLSQKEKFDLMRDNGFIKV